MINTEDSEDDEEEFKRRFSTEEVKEVIKKEQEEEKKTWIEKKALIKGKIKFVAKMLQMQKTLREEHENIVKIKAVNNNALPQGILLEGKKAILSFKDAKKRDSLNERRPDSL